MLHQMCPNCCPGPEHKIYWSSSPPIGITIQKKKDQLYIPERTFDCWGIPSIMLNCVLSLAMWAWTWRVDYNVKSLVFCFSPVNYLCTQKPNAVNISFFWQNCTSKNVTEMKAICAMPSNVKSIKILFAHKSLMLEGISSTSFIPNYI